MTQATGKRSRIVADVPEHLRRRIKVAAAKRDLTVSEYLTTILDATVPQEEKPGVSRGMQVTPEMVERLRKVSEEIMAGKRFKDDSTEIIRSARDERSEQL